MLNHISLGRAFNAACKHTHEYYSFGESAFAMHHEHPIRWDGMSIFAINLSIWEHSCFSIDVAHGSLVCILNEIYVLMCVCCRQVSQLEQTHTLTLQMKQIRCGYGRRCYQLCYIELV